MLDLPGFPDPKATVETDKYVEETFKKKGSKKTGGFQSMNLSFNVLKGVIKRGYKIPTPIQRKVMVHQFNYSANNFMKFSDYSNYYGR